MLIGKNDMKLLQALGISCPHNTLKICFISKTWNLNPINFFSLSYMCLIFACGFLGLNLIQFTGVYILLWFFLCFLHVCRAVHVVTMEHEIILLCKTRELSAKQTDWIIWLWIIRNNTVDELMMRPGADDWATCLSKVCTKRYAKKVVAKT